MAGAIPARFSSVSLVHDYMTQLGGAERVAGILASNLSSASLLTSVHRPEVVPLETIGGRPWKTSFLQPYASHLPLKVLLPALPKAVASLDVAGSELVISSSSAFGHHVRPSPGANHVCYCSTPAHFLWNQAEYFHGRAGLKNLLSPLLEKLRRLDIESARRVSSYIANSHYTAERIKVAYGRHAAVVYPPVELSRFRPGPERSDRFLVVSRLVPAKRVDLVIKAANRFEHSLDVIGTGPELGRLRRLAGPSVQVLGWQPDSVVRRMMAECTAVVVAAREDFGLVIAEAQASGRPPVAFAAGGALEIIDDGVTGFLFQSQTTEAIGEAMTLAQGRGLETSDLVTSAARFDVPRFIEAFHNAIASCDSP